MKKLLVPKIQSQRDPRWASVILGNNTNPAYNIGNWGCLITSFANYLGITPIEVNNHKDLFVAGGGDLIWSKTPVIGLNNVYTSPRYDDAVTPQGLAKMRALIDEGRPLICEIDFNPATIKEEMHFILVHGYDDNDVFYAIDPYTGSEINLDVYGGVKRALYTFRAYNKILPFYTPPVVNDDFKKKIQSYFNYEISADDVIKWCNDRKLEISNLQKTIGEKDQTISNLNSQIAQLEKDKNILADELSVCQKASESNQELNNKLLQVTQELNQLKLDFENSKASWQLKEVDYIKQIKTLQTKYDATKSSIKKLLIDYIFGKK